MSTLNTISDYDYNMIQHEVGTINTEIEDVDYRNKRYNYLASKKPKSIQSQYKIQYSIMKKAYNQMKNDTDTVNEEVTGVRDILFKLKQKKNQKKNRNYN